MFVSCAGVRRSASVLQYQLAKDIVEKSESGIAIGWQISIPAQYLNYGCYVVLKSHTFFTQARDLSCKVFCTHRNMCDVVSSIMAKYSLPFDEVVRDVPAILSEYNDWSSMPGMHMVDYNLLVSDIIGEVTRMSAYLGLSISSNTVEEIASRHTVKYQKKHIESFDWSLAVGQDDWLYDPISLLHKNHFQEHKPTLTKAQREIINQLVSK